MFLIKPFYSISLNFFAKNLQQIALTHFAKNVMWILHASHRDLKWNKRPITRNLHRQHSLGDDCLHSALFNSQKKLPLQFELKLDWIFLGRKCVCKTKTMQIWRRPKAKRKGAAARKESAIFVPQLGPFFPNLLCLCKAHLMLGNHSYKTFEHKLND